MVEWRNGRLPLLTPKLWLLPGKLAGGRTATKATSWGVLLLKQSPGKLAEGRFATKTRSETSQTEGSISTLARRPSQIAAT